MYELNASLKLVHSQQKLLRTIIRSKLVHVNDNVLSQARMNGVNWLAANIFRHFWFFRFPSFFPVYCASMYYFAAI